MHAKFAKKSGNFSQAFFAYRRELFLEDAKATSNRASASDFKELGSGNPF